ncbi:hypothetical protein P7K49_023126 [Saguinus oedipus]|uniref:Uncharacterized protein n=1 Tax=Saguinus oedipus TaxID=9490 RepID=A0ABQ9ULN1_SAGOE|nr:hypothetical protein P7K49_023126 [Saguinus oedipus]
MRMYERRIEWLSLASRRIWGTVCEKRVVILLDISATNSMYIIHIQHSLRLLLEEQLSNKDYFNLIANRTCGDMKRRQKTIKGSTWETLAFEGKNYCMDREGKCGVTGAMLGEVKEGPHVIAQHFRKEADQSWLMLCLGSRSSSLEFLNPRHPWAEIKKQLLLSAALPTWVSSPYENDDINSITS